MPPRLLLWLVPFLMLPALPARASAPLAAAERPSAERTIPIVLDVPGMR